MSATKVNANWTSVTFASTAITKITQGGFGKGGSLSKFSGDGDIYPTTIANLMNEPHASFTTGDVGNAELLVPGTLGTLVATLADARLQTGGAVTYTVTSLAVVENVDSSGSHAAFASSNFSFQFLSADGTTSPVVISRV
jgi:hypothetical protein